jgi:hypothetical protein
VCLRRHNRRGLDAHRDKHAGRVVRMVRVAAGRALAETAVVRGVVVVRGAVLRDRVGVVRVELVAR